MCYQPWAKSARKEWLPEEGPIVLLRSASIYCRRELFLSLPNAHSAYFFFR